MAVAITYWFSKLAASYGCVLFLDLMFIFGTAVGLLPNQHFREIRYLLMNAECDDERAIVVMEFATKYTL